MAAQEQAQRFASDGAAESDAGKAALEGGRQDAAKAAPSGEQDAAKAAPPGGGQAGSKAATDGKRPSSASLKKPSKKRRPSRELKRQSEKLARESKGRGTRGKGSAGARAVEMRSNATRRRYVVVACVVVALACVALLYPAARTYYESKRIEQRTEAQLQATDERNAEIQRQNDYLQTDEGIEDQARKGGGYIKPGEEGVVITNGGKESGTTTQLPEQVDLDQIHAPSTWYYDILDAFFFVHV